MESKDLREVKERVLEELRGQAFMYLPKLEDLDARLADYLRDICRMDMDTANLYELLGARKVLRLAHTYRVNGERFWQWVRAIEGDWVCVMYGDGTEIIKKWVHQGGGLKFSTPTGASHVRLMPWQVWCLFGMYGFDTNEAEPRRLCQESHLLITRKAGKTEFGAAIDYVEANVLGPSNAQVLICANSSDQSKIAFKAVRNFCYQLDPRSANKGMGKYLNVTDRGVRWQPGYRRTAEILPMSAGGKKKDGYFASLTHADEHGSASYVNGHSDMQSAVEVCEGSMGPRRERMLLHTTTAGLVNEGPYQLQLRQVEQLLLAEMEITFDLKPHETDEDKWFALLLRLDPWEETTDLNELRKPNLYRKVNRSIGVTVQPTWYDERIHKALTTGSDDTRREVLTKDFNLWQTSRTVEWIGADEIRALQTDMRIEDCTDEDDWMVAVGMDFSLGRDLHAMTYLAIRKGTGENGQDEYFADMDAWISEETLENSSISKLLHRWVDDGWLHVSPGKTLEPTLPVNRVMELVDGGLNIIGFGYDANKAKMPINALSQWLVDMTGSATAPKQYIIPIGQTNMTYNPQVEELDFMIRNEPALIHFSRNPLWPYEFGCVALDIDTRMGNKKPVKQSPGSDACLVDNVQCLCNANAIIDRLEGSVTT